MNPSRTAFAICLAALPFTGMADGYAMGAGRWTCADVLRVAQRGTASEQGQLAGWLMGFWSAATFLREQGFIDTVERVGGEAIYKATIAECSKSPPETPVYLISQHMIRNTK